MIFLQFKGIIYYHTNLPKKRIIMPKFNPKMSLSIFTIILTFLLKINVPLSSSSLRNIFILSPSSVFLCCKMFLAFLLTLCSSIFLIFPMSFITSAASTIWLILLSLSTVKSMRKKPNT